MNEVKRAVEEVAHSLVCLSTDMKTLEPQDLIMNARKLASLLPLLGDVASKEIAGIEQWHWNEPIPKPFDVLAVLRSKSGSIVWSKVSSVFPIDDNWTVVCWTFVNPNIVIESGGYKSGNVA